MKTTVVALAIFFMGALACTSSDTDTTTNNEATSTEDSDLLYRQPLKSLDYSQTSQAFLQAIRDGEDYQAIQQKLATVDADSLAAELDSKAEKLAFWINVYNANIQTILSENPDLYQDRRSFFGEPRVTVAGKELSFEDIEHGIIRGSESKLLMGYAGKIFVGDYEKKFRVDETDARIHFALNCGAKDCPPVYIYNPGTLDDDLEQLTRTYLAAHSNYDPEKDIVTTTPLFKWFRGDFQAYDGIDDFLVKYGVLSPENKNARQEFKDYDWTLSLGDFG